MSKALYFTWSIDLNSVTVDVNSRAAYDCFKIATASLELSRRASEEWEISHHHVTGITFSAFAIEAMINHYAIIYFPDWNDKRGSRKYLHKEFFKVVNLPNYLGSKEYQLASKCFYLRDRFAHGKSLNESVDVSHDGDRSSTETFNKIMSICSEPFRAASFEVLNSFVVLARKIEQDIETNGFYPNQSNENLCEGPLGVTGIRVW